MGNDSLEVKDVIDRCWECNNTKNEGMMESFFPKGWVTILDP